jgi:diguanylate cyclase (GGDEF)-like protein
MTAHVPDRPNDLPTASGDRVALEESAAREQSIAAEVRLLGDLLAERIEKVLERTLASSQEAGAMPDAVTADSFLEIARSSLTALADWISGGSPEAGRETGRRAFEAYGQMAAERVTPLHEIAKGSLRWRDAVTEALCDSAERVGASPQALARAMAMVQHTADVTHVRMCESFELERARTDEELARRQEELAFMATHDQLTGLPNRTLIVDRGTQMLGRSRRRHSPVAALLLKLDNFKAISDTLGHSAGNELVQAIAARLDGILRDTDALGRLGRDEFVVLAEDLSGGLGVELIAERLLAALKDPFAINDPVATQLTVTASIGMSVGDGGSAEDLLGDAHVATHRATREGGNRYVMFESGMQDLLQSRMSLEMDLRGALERDEFFLVYQPTFDLGGMRPTGVEALLRWKHPVRGTVQPNDFIPLLEETGLITEVGSWVLQQACRQGARWRAEGLPLGMAVNVSARQLDDDRFIADVQETVAHTGLEPSALTLEVTETTLMANTEATVGRLRAIKALGVRIAIDDFGTGYSSLSHLQRFPVDSLKIDRSFISQLTENPEGKTLIRTLVQLGKALSIETLAEGIEHQEELRLLQAAHCDSGQGFLFAHPMEAEDAESFLQSSFADRSPASATA